MKKVCIMVIALAITAALCLPLAGCGSQYTESEVSYAGPMLDNVLAGIKDNNYTEFSHDFNTKMKEAMTQQDFETLANTLQAKIGDYQSKTFAGAAAKTQDNVQYIAVVYKAKYTKETGDVLITISFVNENGAEKVAGLLLSSPNLKK